jgi:hypothetical protein
MIWRRSDSKVPLSVMHANCSVLLRHEPSHSADVHDEHMGFGDSIDPNEDPQDNEETMNLGWVCEERVDIRERRGCDDSRRRV